MNAFMNVTVRVATAQARGQIAALQAQVRALEADAARANAAQAAMGKGGALAGLVKNASRMQWVGRQIQTNFTYPLLIAAGFATKFALDNERAMVRVEKVYGDGSATFKRLSQTEIPALEKAFAALSNEFGVNRAEVIGIAGDWAAAGASGIALARGVKLTLQAMILGEMEAAEATKALIAIQAQFGFTTKELSATLDTLNMVENQTGISMQGLIQGFQRAAGTARSAGIDVEHLAAMLAALVPSAGTAAQAGNGLKTIISRLLSPTKEATEVLGLMGLKTDDVGWKSLNGAQRLELLAQRYQELGKGIKSNTKEIDANGKATGRYLSAQQAVVSSVIASRYQINRFDVLMRDITNSNGYYQRSLSATESAQRNFNQRQFELNKVLNSNPQKLKQVWVIMQNAMADVIQPIIPAIVYLAQEVAKLFNAFANLPGPVQKLVLVLALLLAAVGPITRYFFAWVVLFEMLGGAFTRMSKIFGGGARLLLAPFTLLGQGLSGTLGLVRGFFLGMIRFAGTAYRVILARTAAFVGLQQAAWAGGALIGAVKALWTAMVGIATSGGAATTAAAVSTALATTAAESAGVVARTRVAATGVAQRTALELAESARRIFIVNSQGTAIVASETGTYLARLGALTAYTRTSSGLYAAWVAYILGLIRTLQSGILAIEAGGSANRLALEAGSQAAQAGIVVRGQSTVVATTVAADNARVASAATANSRIIALMVLMYGKLKALALRALPIIFGPWGIAIAAVLGTLYYFRDEISGLFKDIQNFLQNNANGIGGIFTGLRDLILNAFWSLPSGITSALIAVVNVIREAALAVYEWFSYLNPWARHSPSLVESVTTGMDEISRQMSRAKGVGNLFAQVAADLAKFKKVAASLGQGPFSEDRANVAENYSALLPLFDKLVKDWKQLTALAERQEKAIAKQEAVVGRWEKKLDAANKALDRQQDRLDALQEKLAELTSQYQDHQQALEAYADAPLVGMKAMEDQIFANDMAQKALRLEMLRWEEVNGSIEDVRNQYERLQGDIELLKGEAASLRSAGAGSDILGPMEQQIAAMQAQADALQSTSQNSPMNQWQEDLERLQRQGEILDLENSLQFDPLKKQIEDLIDVTQELTFEQIVTGIQQEQAAMAALQPQIDAYTQAVEEQQAVVDAMTKTRDALQDRYDLENEKLQQLQDNYQKTADAISDVEEALRSMAKIAEDAAKAAGKGSTSPGAANFKGAAGGAFPDVGGSAQIGREGGLGDQSALIDQFTKDSAAALGKTFGSFDMLGPLKEKWNQAWGWVKENIGPTVGGIVGAIGDAFGAINLGGGDAGSIADRLGDAWDTARDIVESAVTAIINVFMLFWPDLKRIFDAIKDAAVEIWEDWGPELAKFKPVLGNLGTVFKNLWTVIKPIVAIVGVALVGALKIVASVISQTLWPVLKTIINVIGDVIQVFRGFVELVVGVLSLDLEMALNGIKDIFSGTFQAIWHIIEGAVGVIWGVIKGLVTGIVEFFTWLWDVLVGHSIVPDTVNGIIAAFQLLLVVPKWIWDNVLRPIYNFFVSVWRNYIKPSIDGWWSAIKTAWNALTTLGTWVWNNVLKPVWDRFKDAFSKVKSVVDDAKNKITSAFDTMRNRAGDFVDAIRGIPGKIRSMASEFKSAGERIIGQLWQGMKNAGSIIGDLAGEIWGAVKDKLNAGIRVVNDKIPDKIGKGPFSVNLPNDPFPYFYKGGIVKGSRRGTPIIAGDRGHDEAIIPLSGPYAPKFDRDLPAGMGSRGRGETHLYFYGDLSFPNITDGSDAETFIHNLEILAKD